MTNLEAAAHPAPRAATHPVAQPALPRAAAGYRILRAWQHALDVAAQTHRLARALPAAEHATLGADLRRAGAAVPAHIASGNLSYDATEHRRALAAAQTALARVETLALLAEHLALAPSTELATLLTLTADTLRLVRGLARVTGATDGATRDVRAATPASPLVAPVVRPPARAGRARRAAATAMGSRES